MVKEAVVKDGDGEGGGGEGGGGEGYGDGGGKVVVRTEEEDLMNNRILCCDIHSQIDWQNKDYSDHRPRDRFQLLFSIHINLHDSEN